MSTKKQKKKRFKVTERWIHSHCTVNGAWTREALRLLGVEWPPQREWIGRVVGTTISAEARARFEACGAVARVGRPKKSPRDPKADAFLASYEWRSLRMRVLVRRGARCECCGASPRDGVRINVDHIKPRKLFPELALVESNLQVICEVCNHGKGNWDQTDWRAERPRDSVVFTSTASAEAVLASNRPRLVKRSS